MANDNTTTKSETPSSSEGLNLLLEIMDYQAATKDLSIRMPESPDTDIGQIAHHYNALISELEILTKKLEKSVNTRASQINRINNSLANEVMDRKIAEHALAESLQQAEMANKAKSAFLANMSHELRTPLNSIIGFSEVMDQGIFGDIDHDHYSDYIKAIYDSGNHLLSLINDVLDLSKVEADSMTLDEDDADIAELIKRSTMLVKSMIDRNELSLTVEIVKNCPNLLCDSLRISQVLVNLLSNAIKFTPKGGEIKVSVSLKPNNAITIQVSDTGIGIPEASLGSIFDPFVQVENSKTRNIQGTGLGLSLVHSLIELHGGRIGIDSIESKGTDIYLFFPPERSVLS
ncbi:MAG: hypothetical protein HON65_06760 [Rhodospirillales bacterium]|jgi:signal transduction histidine kinase|nr:hypothetical protein [Rhodospirillales bacterium]